MPTTWLVATPSEIVHSLPEAAATTHTGQHYAFEVRGKKFCYYLVDHHGDGRVALNLKAAPGVQQALVGTAPGRFVVAAYLGPAAGSGWTSAPHPSTGPQWRRSLRTRAG